MLIEPPKGDEHCFMFILQLSYRRISKYLTSFIYRDHSLTAQRQAPVGSNMKATQQPKSI